MSLEFSLYAIAAASVIATAILTHAALREDAFKGWDTSSSYVFVLVIAQCLPMLYAHLSGGRVVYYDVNWNLSIQLSSTVELLQSICRLGTAVFALVVLVKSCLFERRLISGASIIAVLIAALSVLPLLLADEPDGLMASAISVAMLTATIALPGGKNAVMGLAAAGILVAVLAGLLGIVAANSSVGSCRFDKCGPFGYLLYGPTNSENALSMLLTIALPAIFLTFNGKAKWVLSIFTLAIVFTTGARSAALACVAVIVLMLLLRPTYEVASSPLSKITARATVIGGFATAALVPVLNWSPSDFTGRAALWQLAATQVSDNILFGLGQGAWVRNVSIGLIGSFANYSTHNQWVDMLYVGGLVGTTLFACMLVLLFSGWKERSVVPSAFMLTPIAMLSITERPLGFGADDFFVWILPVVLLAVRSSSILIEKPARAESRPALRDR